MESLGGRLLVATPLIEAGPFRRSVVLLLEHGPEGALGVILNRPLEADVSELLPAWSGLVTAPVCLFQGGPVSTDSALAVGLLRGDAEPVGWQTMTGRVGLVDLDVPVPMVSEALGGLRVFAGYAGWSAGQLEAEIDEGSWIVVAATEADLVSPTPEDLWRQVLARQDGDTRLLATFPDDPGLN